MSEVDEARLDELRQAWAADAARQVQEAIAADPGLNNPEQLAAWEEETMDWMEAAIADLYRAEDPDAVIEATIAQLAAENQPPADPVDEETDAALAEFDATFPDKERPEGRQQQTAAGVPVGLRMSETLSQEILDRAAQYGTVDSIHRRTKELSDDDEESKAILAEAEALFNEEHAG
jgi:hypothetical protein